jgi:flagellar basal-body rod protein FlgC
MSIFDSFAISASALTAERLRLDLISNNIANINSTGRPNDPAQEPYRRKVPVFAQMLKRVQAGDGVRYGFRGAGVKMAAVLEDNSPPRLVHDPDHPHAGERGFVAYPDINIVREMVDAMTATRAYEANVTALNAAKDIALQALEIGR